MIGSIIVIVILGLRRWKNEGEIGGKILIEKLFSGFLIMSLWIIFIVLEILYVK
jgi:hypothetical protein